MSDDTVVMEMERKIDRLNGVIQDLELAIRERDGEIREWNEYCTKLINALQDIAYYAKEATK